MVTSLASPRQGQVHGEHCLFVGVRVHIAFRVLAHF
jgi:hypothetical protein